MSAESFGRSNPTYPEPQASPRDVLNTLIDGQRSLILASHPLANQADVFGRLQTNSIPSMRVHWLRVCRSVCRFAIGRDPRRVLRCCCGPSSPIFKSFHSNDLRR